MKRMSRICFTLALLLASLSAVPAADAALKARSATIDPATGYPTWYQDTNSLALTNCLDNSGFCLAVLAVPLPANKADINAGNFPDESFYFSAFTSGTSPLGTIDLIGYRADLEAGFAATPVDGGQAVFSRIRYRVNVTVPGTYVVTHPYGAETYVITAADIGPAPEINFTWDVPGLVAGAFDTVVTTPPAVDQPVVGPTFLTNAAGTFITDPVTGNRYLGNPVATVAVTGSPFGTNFLQITAPNGDNLLITTFGLQGKVIGLDVAPRTNLDLGAANIVTPAAPPQTVTVTNTTGNSITMAANLNAAGIKAGADALDFTVVAPAAVGAVNCAGATLTAVAPGNSCSFDVTFTPAAVPKAARTATILLAPLTVQPAPPAAQLSDPPPVTLNLSGTAQVLVTATSAGHGLITPNTQAVGAGSTVTLTVTPENRKFKVKEVADGAALLGTPPGTPPFTFNAGAVNHTVTATFMPSGDLNASGALDVGDVVKGLKIMAGVQPADADDPDNTAVDVAPLDTAAKPAPDGKIDIGDVLVLLRRVIGLDTW